MSNQRLAPVVFISSTTGELAKRRVWLATELRRWGARHVVHQETLGSNGRPTLENLDRQIRGCDLVVHLVDRSLGDQIPQGELDWLSRRCDGMVAQGGDAAQRAALAKRLFFERDDTASTYTGWEARLALLHDKSLLICQDAAMTQSSFVDTRELERIESHLALLAQFSPVARPTRIERYANEDHLYRVVNQACDGQPLAASPHLLRWTSTDDDQLYIKTKCEGFIVRPRFRKVLDRWLESNESQVMLISAPVGAGKSALMAHLASTLDPKQTARHFCRFTDAATLNPIKIVQHLATQIAIQVPAYGAMLLDRPDLQAVLSDEGAEPLAAWLKGVVGPLHALAAEDRPARLLILIDALDETFRYGLDKEVEGGPILRDMLLAAADQRMPAFVKMVVSARSIRELQFSDSRIKTVHLAGAGEVEQAAVLRKFIQGWVRGRKMSALLRDGRIDEGNFVDVALKYCSGRFLIAKYLQHRSHDEAYGAADVRAFYADTAAGAIGLDGFYSDFFERRIQVSGLAEKREYARFLSIVAVADPRLDLNAIADVLRHPNADKVTTMYLAMSGLLEQDPRDRGSGVYFDHASLKDWLDPGPGGGQFPRAREFAIDAGGAAEALANRCKALADTPEPIRQARTFAGYLAHRGVIDLLRAEHLASAVALVAALLPNLFTDKVSKRTRILANKVIEKIKSTLLSIDRQDHAAEDAVRGLHEIRSAHLRKLLIFKDYETNKFEPVIRLLVQYKLPEEWEAIRDELLLSKPDDIVLRQDIGGRDGLGLALGNG